MPKTLLLADDSVVIQKLVGLSFANEDVELVTTDNGEDALARARELRPDLVLADVVMPGKNGYEVCEAIKSDPDLQHIPVLLLTGTFEAFDEERARAVRSNGHITKPFEAQSLVDRVTELLSQARRPAPVAAAAAPQAPAAAQPAARTASGADGAYEFFDDEVQGLAVPAEAGGTTPDLGADLGSPDDSFEFGSSTPDLEPLSPLDADSEHLDTGFDLEPDGPAAPNATVITRITPVSVPVADATRVALDEVDRYQDPLAAPAPPSPSRDASLGGRPAFPTPTAPGAPPPVPQATVQAPPPLPTAPDPGETMIADDLFADPPGSPPALDDPLAPPPVIAQPAAPPELPTRAPENPGDFEFGIDEPSSTPLGSQPTAAPARSAEPQPVAQAQAPAQPQAPLAQPPPPLAQPQAPLAQPQAPAATADPWPEPDDLELPPPPAALETTGGSTGPAPPVAADYDVSVSDLGDPFASSASSPGGGGDARPVEVPVEMGGSGMDVSPELRGQIHEALEKVAWEAFADLSESIVRQVMQRVETVVWEVVPQMAETLIEEEIRRLKGEDSD